MSSNNNTNVPTTTSTTSSTSPNVARPQAVRTTTTTAVTISEEERRRLAAFRELLTGTGGGTSSSTGGAGAGSSSSVEFSSQNFKHDTPPKNSNSKTTLPTSSASGSGGKSSSSGGGGPDQPENFHFSSDEDEDEQEEEEKEAMARNARRAWQAPTPDNKPMSNQQQQEQQAQGSSEKSNSDIWGSQSESTSGNSKQAFAGSSKLGGNAAVFSLPSLSEMISTGVAAVGTGASVTLSAGTFATNSTADIPVGTQPVTQSSANMFSVSAGPSSNASPDNNTQSQQQSTTHLFGDGSGSAEMNIHEPIIQRKNQGNNRSNVQPVAPPEGKHLNMQALPFVPKTGGASPSSNTAGGGSNKVPATSGRRAPPANSIQLQNSDNTTGASSSAEAGNGNATSLSSKQQAQYSPTHLHSGAKNTQSKSNNASLLTDKPLDFMRWAAVGQRGNQAMLTDPATSTSVVLNSNVPLWMHLAVLPPQCGQPSAKRVMRAWAVQFGLESIEYWLWRGLVNRGIRVAVDCTEPDVLSHTSLMEYMKTVLKWYERLGAYRDLKIISEDDRELAEKLAIRSRQEFLRYITAYSTSAKSAFALFHEVIGDLEAMPTSSTNTSQPVSTNTTPSKNPKMSNTKNSPNKTSAVPPSIKA